MFKGLIAVLGRDDKPTLSDLTTEAAHGEDAREFLTWYQRLKDFPFQADLRAALQRQGKDLDALIVSEDYRSILQCLLMSRGLRYSELPKALIPFHDYADGPHTALEEHLAEGAELFKDGQGDCRLHFTVSPEHREWVLAQIETVRGKYEKNGLRFEIGLSQQRHETDTLGVDEDNFPLRNPDNSLILRPGGHGALLENLQDAGKDIVFIKNIDNLGPVRLRPEVLAQRCVLGGYLVLLQERIFAYLRHLQTEIDPELLEEISRFVEENLGLQLPDALGNPPANATALKEKATWLQNTLDRPLRVCAMVKNQGEPGGGPFWVRHMDGSTRLQIVETAQVDKSDREQSKIVAAATHFNPVDLVCGLRNFCGEAFKLRDYVDRNTYFISAKSKDGKTIKTLELPGLWNGSMAFWNTVFVETPVETFNPVKSVNDLLRANHRS